MCRQFALNWRSLYWKNFTSIRDRNEVGICNSMAHVSRGIQAGERLEIMHEMRLIIIAATVGEVGPLQGGACIDLREDFLKTTDAAKQFRGQPNLAAKFRD